MMDRPGELSVVPARAIEAILAADPSTILQAIVDAYLSHADGTAIAPASAALRFEDIPNARILGLPAALLGSDRIAGIKWISSFPDNLDNGQPRASAVIVLNEMDSGRPTAIMEGSAISAARTAASAAAVARALRDTNGMSRLALIGAGTIGRSVVRYLGHAGFSFESIDVVDKRAAQTSAAAAEFRQLFSPAVVHETDSVGEAVRSADIVVFATTALTPHVADEGLFVKDVLILHISLRDLGPRIIWGAENVVDDPVQALSAHTSLHRAAIEDPGRHIHLATIADLFADQWRPTGRRPVVVSPFGLGVLDIALAQFVLGRASATGMVDQIVDFF